MLKKAASVVMAQNKVVKQVKAISKSRLPPLDDFLNAGDYSGAMTLLEFELRTGDGDSKTHEWLAYAAFHNGDYKRASDLYSRLVSQSGEDSQNRDASIAPAGLLRLYRAACLYHLGQYAEAEAEANKGLETPLRSRILYHCAHKLGKESALLAGHGALTKSGTAEDAACLAAMHVARAHYQDAVDAYKKLLLEKEHKDDAALHFYIALCYYKLDYYEVSLEVLTSYTTALQASAAAAASGAASGTGAGAGASASAGSTASTAAANLKACCAFKLYHGKAAEGELKTITDLGLSLETSDLLRHNLVVFRNGDGALRVLPGLVASGEIPEARLNLAIYHLKNGNVDEASALMRSVTATTPQEYILTAVVNTLIAQRGGPSAVARESLKTAQQAYQLVGSSPTEVDTIPGRCAMASAYYLTRHWDDVCVYLGSVRPYLQGEDAFAWNYGIALAASGNYKDAEEVLLTLTQPSGPGSGPPAIASDPIFVLWLARCCIMNRKPRVAWELYLRSGISESLGGANRAMGLGAHLLHLIAADCYSTGAFYFSAKAYDVLERMELGEQSIWEGKRGACAGVLAGMIAGTEARDPDTLREIISMLRSSAENGGGGAGPGAAAQAQKMAATMTRWAQANGGL